MGYGLHMLKLQRRGICAHCVGTLCGFQSNVATADAAAVVCWLTLCVIHLKAGGSLCADCSSRVEPVPVCPCSACVSRQPARQDTRCSLLWGLLLRLPANLDIHATRLPDLLVPIRALSKPMKVVSSTTMEPRLCIFQMYIVR